jgi:hydroxyacylglutathione hydrolase
LVEVEGGWLAIDASEGFLQELQKKKRVIKALLLTHGHWDHIWDAADLVAWAQCPVYCHADDAILLSQPSLMRPFGLPVDLKPLQATSFLQHGEIFPQAPYQFEILHIPGHCPGSICFYEKTEQVVFGGDVLFAGGVGRWDLPGGSERELISGIKKHLLPLPEEVMVYPGHGDSTTIGQEKRHNLFLR